MCTSIFVSASTQNIRNSVTCRSWFRSVYRKMASSSQTSGQLFDFLLVLDFEATCAPRGETLQPQEIIEFPCLKVNTQTGDVESQFHQYVRPRVHPQLTDFCTELTGIIQDMVDGQPHLEAVLEMFDGWMAKEGLLDGKTTSAFVTCGDWDLRTMLPGQCRHFNITPKAYFSKWINIKKSCAEATSVFPRGMMGMLSMLHLQHTGRHHSGIDDCTNIAAAVKELIRRKYVFKHNGR
ncbi:ERI1 exoribonuclease 3-like isoform X1 [Haliotis rubra]|uniref:ERI1 exoribonuclease 3-like isoform X1 n=1 Tax=Haliotis rubra TaxID=36100 RepID=UPI001EE53164|nr:ERI1 exoribonuclease 3-like isoform X1 [Haliotis rubra]